jgi:hypothetical protein
MRDIDDVLGLAPVIPVLVIEQVEDAVPIATALVAGGLPVIEVTLRTDAALAAIASMKDVPGAVVGAGTILSEEQANAAVNAGAEFLVSPGLTDRLARAAADFPVPLLPRNFIGFRHHARSGARLLAPEILPRRIVRRQGDAEGAERGISADPLLPDRRHNAAKRSGLAGTALRRLRRRQLAGSAGRPTGPDAIRRRAIDAAALRRTR